MLRITKQGRFVVAIAMHIMRVTSEKKASLHSDCKQVWAPLNAPAFKQVSEGKRGRALSTKKKRRSEMSDSSYK